MPVRVTDIPSLQGTQINAAKMDASAASAPAKAWGALAQGIGSISTTLEGIADDAQAAENAETYSIERTAWSSGLGQLQLDLQKDPDPENHLKRVNEFLSQKKGALDKPGVSPVVRARLINEFNDFSDKAYLGVASGAVQLRHSRARQALQNQDAEALRLNDPTLYAQGERTYEETWGPMTPEQKEARKQLFDRNASAAKINSWIQDDPEEAERLLNDPDFLRKNPGVTENDRQTALDRVQSQYRENISKAWDEFGDMLAQDMISTPEEVKAQWGGLVPPRIIEKMTNSLDERRKASMRAFYTTETYQTGATGRAADLISSYNPSAPDAFDRYSEIVDTLQTLPAGSGAREQLRDRLNRIQQGYRDDYENLAEQGLDNLTKAITGRYIDGVTTTQSAQALKDSGFFRDRDKLKQAGFNEESLEYITGKDTKGKFTAEGEKLSDDERKRRFLEKYPQRTDKKNSPDPFIDAAFRAYQKGEGTISYADPAALRKGREMLGDAARKYANAVRLNPGKGNDTDFINKTVSEILTPIGVQAFQTQLIRPRPIFPEITKDGGLPEIPREEAMDWPPGVLPHLDPNER